MRVLVALGMMAAVAATAPAGPPARGSLPEKGEDLAAFFRAMDGNGDGQLDHAEFGAWFSGSDGHELAAYFTMMDADHDGKVSAKEFATFNAQVDRSGD